MRFARCIHGLCSELSRVAFLCCPTAFVAFQHIKPLETVFLLEVDKRFATLAPKQYINYDLDELTFFLRLLKGPSTSPLLTRRF